MTAILISCWPFTRMGLLFYAQGLQCVGPPERVLDADSPGYIFTTLVTLLRMYSEVEALAALVRSTQEIVSLVIKLWANEILQRDLEAQLEEMFSDVPPPTTVNLFDLYLFRRKNSTNLGLEITSVLTNGLGELEIASVGLTHLRRGTEALVRHKNNPEVLTELVDVMHTNLRTLDCLDTPLHRPLLSQGSVRVITEALMALTSISLQSSDVTAACMAHICEYLNKYMTSYGLGCLNESLELGLLLGLLRGHSLLNLSKRAIDAFIAQLTVHLPRYLIYISVLRQVHKSLKVMPQLGFGGVLSDDCQAAWLVFSRHAALRLKIATDAELEFIPCNGSECVRTASMRCSGCWETAYCSPECQKASWGAHSASCRTRTEARQKGVAPDLMGEDVQFALRVAQYDFEEHKDDICTRWTAAGSLPLCAGIDYTVFPNEVHVDAPEVVRDNMKSDAAIYTIFPQGAEGKEYYLCDLGLTRGAEDSDGATIEVVVQMVRAQPVPAFFKIN
ncbi:hypothetical protein C8R43DRAFT_1234531 [Mycena crocata]|nr:hypothetical protein C8R43DRAFT_1234531 [Mycena crocata]